MPRTREEDDDQRAEDRRDQREYEQGQGWLERMDRQMGVVHPIVPPPSRTDPDQDTP